jgi:16S rRNA (uracil1498-N3)-methyltransferase
VKHIHRFFVANHLSAGETVCLDTDDSFHASRVLRLRTGDSVEVAGADGCVFDAEVTLVDGFVEVMTREEMGVGSPAVFNLTVVQVLPKGKKLDLVVEKLSELGIARLAPVYSEKSVVRARSVTAEKLERWRRIARSAASQSRRDRVMEIETPKPLEEWLGGQAGTLLVLATEVEVEPLGVATMASAPPLSLLIGPEAGFSSVEIDELRDRGAVFTGLGRLVLRTETAALAAAAIIMHRLGALG